MPRKFATMEEEVQLVLEETKESMFKALKHLEEELRKVRAGKASPDMVNGITVEYYGSPTPINQVASVKLLDARTIVIVPFEKKLISEIERSIFQSNIGITPQNDGENIRLSVPPTTEERRRDLVKQSKNHGEQTKVVIRNARKEGNEMIKGLVKDGLSEDIGKGAEESIQQLTNEYNGKVDKMLQQKEEEIMTI
ncbi:MAG TPA: ribosome recycling factor [Chitinophagales bacterium]|nr:ribosome recycling factor [Chitinophagales bacterium]HNM31131.1 ribosome recycling factor [Chitinophagales bacterium]